MPRSVKFDTDKVIELNLLGISDTEIARQVGSHQTRISDWRRRNGIPIRRPCWACNEVFIAKGGQASHCGECGKHKCSRCKLVKTINQFSTRSGTTDGINNVCKPCEAEKHRPHHKRYGLKARYGLTPEQVTALWDLQEQCCYLCKEPLAFADIRIDHDSNHCGLDSKAKGCSDSIRGAAHHACNVLIGFAGESPTRLRIIADNLERATANSEAATGSRTQPEID